MRTQSSSGNSWGLRKPAMKTITSEGTFCDIKLSYMLKILRKKFRRLCWRIRCVLWKRRRPRVVIKRFGRLNLKHKGAGLPVNKQNVQSDGTYGHSIVVRPVRIVTFNVAMFSLAPAIPKVEDMAASCSEAGAYTTMKSPYEVGMNCRSANYYPKSILKESPLHNNVKSPEHLPGKKRIGRSKPKVSINLPDNEISLANENMLSYVDSENEDTSDSVFGGFHRSPVPFRSPVCFPYSMANCGLDESLGSKRSILEVLREVDADILALQDVKAVEEKGMRPLSELASALGMKFVFAESWAPEYGNAILSKWPIKRWKVQKIANDEDFRNVLKATIEIPGAGELNFYCTQLDHLDESWRMKQISALVQSNDSPYILAGGLNSLSGSDYSSERWGDIVKYYEKIGKPTPRVEVMKFLKGKGYVDAKDFPGDCEPVVMIAKGQNVQGTCKYGTRVDYIMACLDSPFEFVPGSYSVISSKGTSDHHIVKVDVMKICKDSQENFIGGLQKQRCKVVKIMNSCSSRGIWSMTS